jgi:hypothetical protein
VAQTVADIEHAVSAQFPVIRHIYIEARHAEAVRAAVSDAAA